MDNTILKLDGITKIYPNGTVANRNISISFNKGEIHSICGENGAGKTTLMNIIFAIEKQTEGKISYKGQEINYSSSLDAIENGIGMVHQHFMLIPSFTVAQNVVLGAEPKKANGFIDMDKANQITNELAKKYKFDEINATDLVSDLTVSAKQKVEILKTLYRKAEVIILDEPTAVLTPQETVQLFEQLKGFKELGHTIIFISHKLNEVKEISDRITVIRSGETKGTYDTKDVSIEKLTELIIGHSLESSYDSLRKQAKNNDTILSVENLSFEVGGVKKVDNVNFAVHAGEILGIAGVQGNGQEELIKVITGMEAFQSGKVILGGVDISTSDILHKREAGLAYIPEDRMQDGIAATASIQDNAISTYYRKPEYSGKVFMKGKNIRKIAQELIQKFQVKTNSEKQRINSLSGGNIQKVVVAREWQTSPKCMIASQPTRGIDIGSANYIHHQLIDMRNNGAAILLISADLNEVMAVSDSLIVMFEGKIVAYFKSAKDVSANELGFYMLGTKKQSEEEIKEASK